MPPEDVHVEIDFTRDVEPVTGRVTAGADGSVQEFSGWMELVAALDAVRGAAGTSLSNLADQGARPFPLMR